MASDYSPPRLVKPTPGGNPGDGSMDGALTVQSDANTLVYLHLLQAGSGAANAKFDIYHDSVSTIYITDDNGNSLVGLIRGGPIYFVAPVRADGGVSSYRGVNTAAYGLSPIYGLGSRVTVAATTSPGTTLTSFTPGATGSCKVNVTIKNKDTVAVTAYVLVAYTDPDVGAQSVLIINGVSIAASGVASASFVLDSTAAAITVSAYGSVANELVCTADIEQFA